MMFFRSGFIGYYDLYNDSGTKHFAGQRLGCWVNAIPGNGLVMIPEASAGCVCQFSIASTVVLEPKSKSSSWGIFSAVGSATPVQRLGINFGAPGDHRDDGKKEWFGFPRPSTRGRLEYTFDIKPKFAEGGGWFSRNQHNANYRACEQPWRGRRLVAEAVVGEELEDALARFGLARATLARDEQHELAAAGRKLLQRRGGGRAAARHRTGPRARRDGRRTILAIQWLYRSHRVA